VLVASTHVYGLYRSTDFGQSWQAAGQDLPKVGFNAMTWAPGSGDLYGAAASSSFPDHMLPAGLPNGDDEPGVYRSTDGGLTWEDRSAGLPHAEVKGIAFSSDTVYAATVSGLYASDDEGDSWSELPGGPELGYGTIATGSGVMYVGTLGGGVHKGTVGPGPTLSWSGSSGPIAEIHNVQVRSATGQQGVLYATAFPGGVYKSTDGGTSWQEANFGLPGFTLPDPARNGYYALAINRDEPDNLYLGIFGYGVYRSDDGAATWLRASEGLGNLYVYSLMVEEDGSHVWVGTNDGIQSLWRAPIDEPGPLAWSPAPVSPESQQVISGIVINRENTAEMTIVAMPAGVFETRDGGENWYERTNNLQVGKRLTHGVGFEDGYYQLSLDPVNPRHLFYGTYTGQVYETRDGGMSWSDISDGLMREGSIYALEIAGDGSRLYVSQKAGGVSRRALDPTAPRTRVVAVGARPCTDGSHVYGTVGAGLQAANQGDRIVVCPGSYDERVTVDEQIRLESFAGPSRTYLDSVTVTADKARVAGFLLRALTAPDKPDVVLLGNVLTDEVEAPTATPTGGSPVPTPAITPTPSSTPEVTLSPTPEVTSTPTCINVLPNGDFESGIRPPWQAFDAAQITSRQAHGGVLSVQLGGAPNLTGELLADSDLPWGATSITMDYWSYVQSTDDDPDADVMTVIAGPPGSESPLETITNQSPRGSWRPSSHDLTAHAGKRLNLTFHARTNEEYATTFYVDDVTIQVCGSQRPSWRVFLPSLKKDD
jgi:photosystem II stability/assembly factor-like uncharacterized protein